MGQAGPLPQAATSGLQVQSRSQVVRAAHEERATEQDERGVRYSLRAKKAQSRAPTKKRSYKEILTMSETHIDILEASLEELYQGQRRLLGVESSQEEFESWIDKVESLVDQLMEDTKDFVEHMHEVVTELTSRVSFLIRTFNVGGSNTRVAPPQNLRAPEPHCYGDAKDAK
ncbi:hypothetical protein B296_00049535 [Ensete ventricosum]|uniref:Uncharacterized protein n=1 Tax=Ensete ventricosum TaxID=4639 RepID=A0A426XHB2_ENSVE|nr:hypothetical protein B296_00049535 [Ensete ventricosum]